VRTYRIAAIPADGIGLEVIPAGIEVLKALEKTTGSFRMTFKYFDWGSDHYHAHGRMMPEDGLETLKAFDAIYFGAVGHPSVPDHISLWGLRLPICQGFEQYANVRPARLLPGVQGPLRDRGPGDLDWVIVRENTEGEYAGVGGRVHQGHPEEVGMEVAVFTRTGVARVMRFAFELARKRPKRHLTLVTKSNAQRHGMVLWDSVFQELAAGYPDITTDRMLVDAATTRMVLHPGTLDVLVATNLHADILSDLAAALSGSLGMGATANLNPERRYPSMFEPIHGSAFDIMGKGIANPIGTFWSAVLMLEHLGETEAAGILMAAVETVTAQGRCLPADLGGTAKTREVTEAVCEALRNVRTSGRTSRKSKRPRR
jgi:tartrate dehydrogenase/decarboxylase / D-malate dehydrogenase